MAWFLNHYHCSDCDTSWDDEWSCCCDDECPVCGSGDWTPLDSEDLSVITICDGTEFEVLYSGPEVQEHKPRYKRVARLSSEILADVVANAFKSIFVSRLI